jgi:apolipoprotein N-acyltransferase
VGFLAYVVLIPFVLASGVRDGRGRYLLNSFLFGFAYFMGSLYWIAMLAEEQIAVPWLRLPAAIVLCLYLSLFMVVTGWLAGRLVMLRIPLPLALAGAWAVIEYLRSLGPLGFTWASLGYTQTPNLGILQMASVVGTYGISALIVLVNALLAELLICRRWRYVLTVGACILVPLTAGRIVLDRAVPGEKVKVALVQPNISGTVKWNEAYRDTSMVVLERLTLKSSGADLIVWPETAVPFNVLRDDFELERIKLLASRVGSHLLVGSPDYENRGGELRYFNTAFLISPAGGPEDVYRKIHLVPFGEMIPFEDRFDVLKRIDLGEGDFSPGTDATVFDINGSPFAVAICFESIYPDLMGDFVDAGARFIVNITNDEWFGPSIGPSQHAQMAVMRAAEYRVGLARCANTGISMVVDPYGRIVGQTDLFVRDVLKGEVEVGRGGTIYGRIGGCLETVALAVCLLLALFSYFGRPRRVKKFDTPEWPVVQ